MATPDSTRRASTTKHVFFKEEFDRLATDGYIGRADGKPAYAYIRVSSDEQGEEGRSGLPRQIEHIHQKAIEAGYCITWDRVYADDYTGFEFDGRPGLDRLRREYGNAHRHACAVVMEHLDRLSRNADWHQGFLLHEMEQASIAAVFWKSFSSRIERAVMGAVSQEGMEQALARMTDGTRKKAESGRVTSKRPAYGFRFVDDNGEESSRARKMTHYATAPDHAAVVRLIYERVAAGDTLRSIARDLTIANVQPPKNTKVWRVGMLSVIIRNEVYRGEFIANRFYQKRVEAPTKDGLATRMVMRTFQRPESEWQRVPVPAIVDAATWQAANDMLDKNKVMAARNVAQGERYLLTGLLKCVDCGLTFRGRTFHPRPYNHLTKSRKCYGCPTRRNGVRYERVGTEKCSQPHIAANKIEPAVWSAVCATLLDPEVLIAVLHEDIFNAQNAQLEQQIGYLEAETERKQSEDEKLYRAYVAGAFDENEYRDRRALLKMEAAKLQDELARLYPKRVTAAQFEAQKQQIVRFAEYLRAMDATVDPPFEVKQRILKMTVSQIVLNSHENWFRLEGAIQGTFTIENS